MTRCVGCKSLIWPWQRRETVRECLTGGPVYVTTMHLMCAARWLREWLTNTPGPITVSQNGRVIGRYDTP